VIVTIAASLDDVRSEIAAVHGDHIVVLGGVIPKRVGYARGHIAAPVARLGGVAVVQGARALGGVPDPVVVLLARRKTLPPGVALVIDPAELPVQVEANIIRGVVRRVRPLRATMPPEAVDVGHADEPDHRPPEDGAAPGADSSGGDAVGGEATSA
jgi:hypothetical protein